MGFAERTIVPANLVVNIRDLSFEEACILEPMGVAADLILTADIHLNDDVLLLGRSDWTYGNADGQEEWCTSYICSTAFRK